MTHANVPSVAASPRRIAASLGLALVTVALGRVDGALAQPTTPATAQPPAEPAGTAADLPPPPPPSYAEAPAGAACVPSCRAGFMCHEGQCVSACNPPCGAGQQCAGSGECVAEAGAMSAPSFPEPEPAIAAPPPTGARQHDGLLIRITGGFGGAGASIKPQGGGPFDFEEKYSGGGVAFGLDIGFAPVDDLVLHARFSDLTLFDPTVTLDGEKDTVNGSIGTNFFGPAVSYYFMPINMYLTGAIGLGWMVLASSDTDKSSATDLGLGLNFDFGKEWWVSGNWGLGVSGRLVYVSGSDGDDASTAKFDYSLLGFAVLFSATYQ